MNKISYNDFFERLSKTLRIQTQQELASLLGVNRSAITQAKKRNAVPERWILKIARDYGLQPQWLSTGAGAETSAPLQEPTRDVPESAFIEVPKVRARLCAGGGSFEVGANIEDYYAFKRDWLLRKGSADNMVLMDVFGNSMEPEIKEGDTVLVDQQQQAVIAGGIYAVGVEDTVMVKRIEKRPSALVLLSDNTDYSPVVLQGDELDTVRIIGKVVWCCREYR